MERQVRGPSGRLWPITQLLERRELQLTGVGPVRQVRDKRVEFRRARRTPRAKRVCQRFRCGGVVGVGVNQVTNAVHDAIPQLSLDQQHLVGMRGRLLHMWSVRGLAGDILLPERTPGLQSRHARRERWNSKCINCGP
jgi:hypothetical protein